MQGGLQLFIKSIIMCLSIYRRYKLGDGSLSINDIINSEKKIATSPITVYKSLCPLATEGGKVEYASVYRRYKYELGYLYENYGKNKFKFSVNFDCNNKDIIRYWIDVYEGLHSYKEQRVCKVYMAIGECMIKCTVPEGAEYFENNKAICSSQLFMGEVIYQRKS
jgi:hypothetical protein